MPSLRDIRRRIRGVRNVSQITKAMETVAASRLRRAQERVMASRPYVEALEDILADLAGVTAEGDVPPLLAVRQVERVALVMLSPNRGLAGPLPGNLNRRAALFIANEAGVPVDLVVVGKKGRDFMSRRGQNLIAEFTDISDRPVMADVLPIAQIVINGYANGDFDRVVLIYTRFLSMVGQQPELKQLLPVEPPSGERTNPADFIYEPSPGAVLNELLPRYVETLIYQAQLESQASFYAAQMVAMRNATDNAKEVIGDLTLTYNKVRQAVITKEVAEIASGAEAMAKG
ncbi:MAG TPA: ATP synthase F1 subunit gamma [Chloroflexota bacterium]|nr:ATP synthase F1 subunit gamma [Chloroflexota bacterium]